ncbi:uncharacterized protein SOCG_03049 [Schizosaccharomyces octosporus yFS286]|uniref:RWD domain-containing protein n=1 Tax=Schizosaccharomyces octosporus (strain yFS286) TaxID=483514 RepID=S9PXL6_SCHOY|nr:uncharacterized protein SOCG_03049 [Schizosaccharomyces octosporus yFS286]EPX73831.1 hypothetical protein SOCG_03049 [Schizosaccharomyces octosporus yFS286]
MEDNEAFQDELLALESIYPSCLLPISEKSYTYTLSIPDSRVHLNLQFPIEYPDSPPIVLDAYGIDKALAEDVLLSVATGDVCIFSYIDLLKELVDIETEQEVMQNEHKKQVESEKDSPVMLDKNQYVAKTPETHQEEWKPSFDWKESQAINDRKSTFAAHATRVHSPEEVQKALEELYMNKKVAKANHNMVAYRVISQRGNVIQDNDDDGESAAGSRMGHLLTMMDAENVFVCVSRWFGGTHIGPDRFKHINSTAREAVLLTGAAPEQKKGNDDKKKKKHR